MASKVETNEKITRKKKKWRRKMRDQPNSHTTLHERGFTHDYYKKLLPEDEQKDFETERTLQIVDHAAATAKEIRAMSTAIDTIGGGKTALQLLPRSIRRRAASHNLKRLPRSIRQFAQHFKDEDKKDSEKKVGRKKRRKKVSSQNEYAKRSGKVGWMETHLWHAKRFHMSESSDPMYNKWQCRVPLHSNEKSKRGTYRHAVKHCLIQDLSYMKCIILEGLNEALDKLIRRLTLACTEKKSRLEKVGVEVELFIYDKTSPLPVCIGPALFSKLHGDDDGKTKLMIWLHPTMIEQTFPLISKEIDQRPDVSYSSKSAKLNRFRLSGPKASVTLLSVLNPYPTNNSFIESENIKDASKMRKWIIGRSNIVEKQNENFRRKLADTHRECFSRMETEFQFPDGEVLPAIVEDPRLILPLQKTMPKFSNTANIPSKAEGEQSADDDSRNFITPLMNEENIEQISKSRIADHIVSTRKNSEKLADDEQAKNDLMKKHSTPVPVIVISNKGVTNSSQFTGQNKVEDESEVEHDPHRGPPDKFMSGYDLILPAGWATAFWISFVYKKVLPCANRDLYQLQLEMKRPSFPVDFPDTEAGSYYWHHQKSKNVKQFYGRTPKKRVNHVVLACPFPFAPNWEHLFIKSEQYSDENASSNQKLAVKRPHEEDESGICTKKIKIEPGCEVGTSSSSTKGTNAENIPTQNKQPIRCIRDVQLLKRLNHILSLEATTDGVSQLEELVASQPKHSLVCVQLGAMNKGLPCENSTISMPRSEDLKKLYDDLHDLYSKGFQDCTGPVEPTQDDPTRKTRQEETRIRKKNRKTRNKDQRVKVAAPSTRNEFDVMPSRKTIGFITSGGFTHFYAKGGGVGFVSLEQIVSLYKLRCENEWLNKLVIQKLFLSSSNLVSLVRSPGTAQYRYALLQPYLGW